MRGARHDRTEPRSPERDGARLFTVHRILYLYGRTSTPRPRAVRPKSKSQETYRVGRSDPSVRGSIHDLKSIKSRARTVYQSEYQSEYTVSREGWCKAWGSGCGGGWRRVPHAAKGRLCGGRGWETGDCGRYPLKILLGGTPRAMPVVDHS